MQQRRKTQPCSREIDKDIHSPARNQSWLAGIRFADNTMSVNSAHEIHLCGSMWTLETPMVQKQNPVPIRPFRLCLVGRLAKCCVSQLR